eukprot:CAMPEP_0175120210 /NCGR_PEP_ID=MMETSP0087-20121206/494_1 /TAXON_ID=136419 /ORGANISM="Unknown Unknown, Strain D1" /LENGTH=70 /DNA_ID=CAMNT_0016401631 /DNA_START=196 /DNA_END=408 /DNA_ORIENTATION=+
MPLLMVSDVAGAGSGILAGVEIYRHSWALEAFDQNLTEENGSLKILGSGTTGLALPRSYLATNIDQMLAK